MLPKICDTNVTLNVQSFEKKQSFDKLGIVITIFMSPTSDRIEFIVFLIITGQLEKFKKYLRLAFVPPNSIEAVGLRPKYNLLIL